MSAFSQRLKQLRHERQLSQSGLGRLLDMKPSTLANYEQGTRSPDAETLCRIADFFGVSLDFLVGRMSEPKIRESPVQLEVLFASNDLMAYGRVLSRPQKDAILAFIRTLQGMVENSTGGPQTAE